MKKLIDLLYLAIFVPFLSSADPVSDFQLEQRLFDPSFTVLVTQKKTGNESTTLGDKQKVLSWASEEFNTGPGYRVNQVEVNKKDGSLRVRSTTFVGEKVRTVTECVGANSKGLLLNTDSKCVTATNRICADVLKVFREQGSSGKSAKSKAAKASDFDQLKVDLDRCVPVLEKYKKILQAFSPKNSGDESEMEQILKAEKSNVGGLLNQNVPSFKPNWVNDLSYGMTETAALGMGKAQEKIEAAKTGILQVHHELHRYISLCEQTENRFEKENQPRGESPKPPK